VSTPGHDPELVSEFLLLSSVVPPPSIKDGGFILWPLGRGSRIITAPSPFIATGETLLAAFAAYSRGQPFAVHSAEHSLPDERVFIVSWVDYCNKYGMGYALTDGSVGVHFNDSTSLVLSCDKMCVWKTPLLT
jgi:hypothetical protein